MFKFYGSKYTLAPRYPEPEYGIVVEPFAGSAAYAVLYRKDTDRVVLIEKDAQVVALWNRLLQMSPAELLEAPAPEVGSTSSDLLVAFAAGRTTRDTPKAFRVTQRMAERYRPMVTRIASVLEECRHFEVRHGDYTEAPDLEATWFIDPPYQWQSGRWDRTRGGRYLYPNRDIDYPELGRWSRERSGQVIVCEQEGADWMPWTGALSARDGGHQSYGEVIYHSNEKGQFE